ncbi:MAG: low molecular weight protein-tyrosine-phosphatase [Gammaproteobacteria bacterium]
MKTIKVLFVCMGNICRSPTGQGVFESLVRKQGLEDVIEIDSAGTHAFHVGEPPDSRATSTARLRNIDLSTQRARKVNDRDYEVYDYILAMDNSNLEDLRIRCPEEHQLKLYRLLDFSRKAEISEVPDPYYGGSKGFERVLDLVEDGAEGLLKHIQSKL